MSFSGIIGHQRQIGVLRRVLRHGNPGPAYLFSGPPGVGKGAVAREFARALLCLSKGAEACGSCRSCAHWNREGHPDYIRAVPEGKTFRIAQVREIQGFLSLTPAWGERKVALLEGAERMNEEAANALLKTLEEPPPGVTVILVSSNANAFPATVVSRCQRLSFGPLSDGETSRVLVAQGMAPEEAEAAAAMYDGSPGMVLDLGGEGHVKSRKVLDELAAAAGDGSKTAVLTGMEKMTLDRAGAEIMLKMLLGRVRKEIRRRLEIDGDGAGSPMKALGDAGEEQLLWLADRLIETSRLLEGNVNPKLALGGLFTEWADRAGGAGPVSHRTAAYPT